MCYIAHSFVRAESPKNNKNTFLFIITKTTCSSSINSHISESTSTTVSSNYISRINFPKTSTYTCTTSTFSCTATTAFCCTTPNTNTTTPRTCKISFFKCRLPFLYWGLQPNSERANLTESFGCRPSWFPLCRIHCNHISPSLNPINFIVPSCKLFFINVIWYPVDFCCCCCRRKRFFFYTWIPGKLFRIGFLTLLFIHL